MYIKKAFPTKIIYIYRQVDSIRDAKSKKAMKWKKKKRKIFYFAWKWKKKFKERTKERKDLSMYLLIGCMETCMSVSV